jgi:predicted RNA-binding protein with PIN domain
LFVRDLDATDDELSARWLTYWRRCVELFDHVSIRAALGRLATALRERRRMTGAEIAQVVDAEALQAAREASSSN